MTKWLWRILKHPTIFLLFFNYLPVWLYLNNLVSPSLKDALYQLWLKLTLSFLEEKIFKSPSHIFTLSYRQLSLFWKGPGPLFELIWKPFTQRCLMPTLIEIDPVVLFTKSTAIICNNHDLVKDPWCPITSTFYDRTSQHVNFNPWNGLYRQMLVSISVGQWL